jgi:hypothetical protein
VNGTETHRSVEELAAYHAGELPETAEASVQDHLVGCRECTRMLLDLDALRRGTDPADEAPDDEKEAFWQALHPRLLSDRSSRRLRISQLLAATLAAAVVGLAIQNAGLRRTVRDLSQPDLGAPVRDLSATANRDAAAPAVVTLTPDDRFFTLVLSPADPRDFPDHEVVLEKAGGGEIWRGRGLRKNRYGTFSLILARRLTGDGDHALHVFGIAGEQKELVGVYHFRIEIQQPP